MSGAGSARLGVPFDWDAREWDARYALYCWGPDVPADFIENKEQP